MKEAKSPSNGSRATALVLVLAVVALGGWAAYTYGPRPAAPDATGAEAAPADSTSTGTATAEQPMPAPRAASCCGGGVAEVVAAPPLPDYFGGLNPPAASGKVEGSRSEFLDKLEQTYRARGYKNLKEIFAAAIKSRTRRPSAGKFYWRYESDAAAPAYIGATGTDADPHSETQTPRPTTFTTMVVADGQGSEQWVTYRHDLKRAAQLASGAKKSEEDAPGLDPPGVPRPPGLRRLFSSGGEGESQITFYTSAEPAVSLVRWYTERMTPNWQYEPVATAQAKELSEGAMCFTQGRRFCLVWIAAGRDGDPTSVIISLKS
jgi:hypothetical protein